MNYIKDEWKKNEQNLVLQYSPSIYQLGRMINNSLAWKWHNQHIIHRTWQTFFYTTESLLLSHLVTMTEYQTYLFEKQDAFVWLFVFVLECPGKEYKTYSL